MNASLRVPALSVAIAAFAWSGAASGETWSCDMHIGEKPYKQEWLVSGDQMTAPRGKGSYRVLKNDQRVLVAFHKFWDKGVTTHVIIEKTSGTVIEMDDIVMTSMGETYKDIAAPHVDVGHCALTRP